VNTYSPLEHFSYPTNAGPDEYKTYQDAPHPQPDWATSPPPDEGTKTYKEAEPSEPGWATSPPDEGTKTYKE